MIYFVINYIFGAILYIPWTFLLSLGYICILHADLFAVVTHCCSPYCVYKMYFLAQLYTSPFCVQYMYKCALFFSRMYFIC
jgi:hypothetical protein